MRPEVRPLFVFRWIVAIISVAAIVTFAFLANRAAALAEGDVFTAPVVSSLVWLVAVYLSANLLMKIRK